MAEAENQMASSCDKHFIKKIVRIDEGNLKLVNRSLFLRGG